MPSSPLLRLLVAAAAVLLLLIVCLPPPSSAQLVRMYPRVKTAVALDHTTSILYFTHATDSRISGVHLTTGVQQSYSLVNSSLTPWSGLAVDGRGSLYAVDSVNNRTVRVNASTGEVSAVYTTSSPALHWPCGVAVDSADGAVNCRVHRRHVERPRRQAERGWDAAAGRVHDHQSSAALIRRACRCRPSTAAC